jgi:hypothetical protein
MNIWRFKNLIAAIENLRKHLVLVLVVKSFNIVFWLYRASQNKKKKKKKGCLKDPKRSLQ